MQEFSSPSGDHCKAAESFLLKVLPFLAKVIIQDGIYWIHHHPQNSASQILLGTKIGTVWYTNWARTSRQIVTHNVQQIKREKREQDQIAATVIRMQSQLDESNNLLRQIASTLIPAPETSHVLPHSTTNSHNTSTATN